ncbi:MAG: hypothetical protein JWN46_2748 [Acidimicrobiales bacterium]|nr:hypothetical protein [Acidimicrobiales bacterium]
MGPTVAAVAERIAEGLAGGWDLAPLGLEYPANPFSYRRSCRAGADALATTLGRLAAHDPARRLVIIGLSQGADVVRRTLADPALVPDAARLLSAVVLLGDPTRRPGDPGQRGSRDPRPGILAHRATPVPATFHDRLWSYTLAGDAISAHRRGPAALVFSGSHTHYVRDRDGVLGLAAAFVVDQLTAPTSGH